MYAVITTGGKQHTVRAGQIIKVAKLDNNPGSNLQFAQVLLVGAGDSVQVGQPFVANCNVTAQVVDHGKDKKINIIKFKRRKHHMKRMGHRQQFTRLKITDIALAGS